MDLGRCVRGKQGTGDAHHRRTVHEQQDAQDVGRKISDLFGNPERIFEASEHCKLQKEVNRPMRKVVRLEEGEKERRTVISNPPTTNHMEKMSKNSISEVWNTPSTVLKVMYVKPSEGSGDISETRVRRHGKVERRVRAGMLSRKVTM